ncbi:GNAT family N-acetyltransferase [Desulfitobacterium metallireducens]|uniref:GNAT family N-acetyltransferase n=1 Tax=Desulfitobacterium metallireducens TaxID=142877 RepID=UPI0002313B4E|nr:GNAT family N-acetyltransferase [Desulfitobacterium metallireducens]
MDLVAPSISNIRRALPEEAVLLTEIAFRSKAHWGYDLSFMEQCRNDLTIFSDNITNNLVFVIEADGDIVGFYELRGKVPEANLYWLFMDPKVIGCGYGKRLWLHAAEISKGLGFEYMLIKSDPYAEGFYLRMGAKRIGKLPSTAIQGLMLPLLCYQLLVKG